MKPIDFTSIINNLTESEKNAILDGEHTIDRRVIIVYGTLNIRESLREKGLTVFSSAGIDQLTPLGITVLGLLNSRNK